MTHRKNLSLSLLLLAGLASSPAVFAQDPKPGQPGYTPPPARTLAIAAGHFGDSPFDPPEANDATFVVDQDAGLDTGCTYRGGGPLVFRVKIGRVVGDVAKLKQNNMISATAELRMPAFDVDFDAVTEGFNPERDRVTFNGNVVPTEFLTGSDSVWKLNSFRVPIEWVRFPADPGQNGSPAPEDNVVQIDIDTANGDEFWCTSIDWAALSIEVSRPIVLAHGILSNGGTWAPVWTSQLTTRGLPHTNELNMGNLDSIQNNAGKISRVVASSRRRWGVDKVNLVCHSKGGLDSRHFVEGNDGVDQVIQIGTPNAGSPLADAVQGAVLRLLGPLPAILINALAGPAGVQLTQPYMRTYNLFHGSNPDVQYTALAGDYNPDCFFLNPFCRPVDRLLLLISGRGDTIVPVRSVHALGYTRNRVFQSSGGNGESKHTQMTKSQGIFSNLRDRVQAFGRLANVSDEQLESTVGRTATLAGALSQGQVQTWQLPVDASSPTFFSLAYPSGNLDLALVAPSGRRYDPVTVLGESNVSREEAEIPGGFLEVYNFNAPETGLWTVEVTAVSVVEPAGTVGYAAHGWVENPAITLAAGLKRGSVPAGTPLEITGTVRENGVPLPGVAVAARVGRPDGTVSQVILLDDGQGADTTAEDGVYTGRLSDTGQPGTYRVLVTANGTGLPATPAFSREDFTLATVSRSTSSISGTFRDRGEDTDGDGLYNTLAVDVDLAVTAAGTYRLFGLLTDASGNRHEASVVAELPSGSATLSLRFDGAEIYGNGVDGPYTLSAVRLAEESELDLLPIDEKLGAHQTAGYSFRQFQHAPIVLTGGGSSTSVDTNGNSLFDLLNVGIGVDVDLAGFYSWSARLLDANGNELGFAASSGFFDAGVNTLTLSYAGEPIGRSGVDGPYFVTDLLVFGAGRSLVAASALTTQPFLASQFEGFALDQAPPQLTVTLSPTALWPPNHRLEEIVATISVEDDQDPHPVVRLVSITSSEPDNGLGDGDTANDIQGADLGTDDRRFFLRAERSGTGTGRTYTVTYEASDAAGNITTVTKQVTAPISRPK
ncbi:MAG TPA: choice-of-anchor X domain-containing protein [Thermoanaerobaculia bacterium]|nr:choice-of-anchor X domain-containing protein [Thermoanaerobaculia bacterium]